MNHSCIEAICHDSLFISFTYSFVRYPTPSTTFPYIIKLVNKVNTNLVSKLRGGQFMDGHCFIITENKVFFLTISSFLGINLKMGNLC